MGWGISGHRGNQPGRRGTHVRALRRAGELTKVVKIRLGNLAKGLACVRTEHEHQVAEIAHAVDRPEHVPSESS
jgi:hypothetical protein